MGRDSTVPDETGVSMGEIHEALGVGGAERPESRL